MFFHVKILTQTIPTCLYLSYEKKINRIVIAKQISHLITSDKSIVGLQRLKQLVVLIPLGGLHAPIAERHGGCGGGSCRPSRGRRTYWRYFRKLALSIKKKFFRFLKDLSLLKIGQVRVGHAQKEFRTII